MGALHRLFIAAAVLFIIAAGSGYAQAPAPAPAPPPNELQQLHGQMQEQQRVIANLMAQIAESRDYSVEQRAAVNAAKIRSLLSYYNSQASFNENGDRLRAYQQQVFAWQLMAGSWLLGVVVLLSICGVAFAGYEMISSRRLVRNSVMAAATAQQAGAAPAMPGQTVAAPAPGNITTLTIEPTKVQVTSAVIGIVILTLSLGFLYLFLHEVYAIDVIDLTDTGRNKVVSTQVAESPKADDRGKSSAATSSK